MRSADQARKTETPTGTRPGLDWINVSSRFLSAFICVHLRLKTRNALYHFAPPPGCPPENQKIPAAVFAQNNL
jgi:hypothetical protein